MTIPQPVARAQERVQSAAHFVALDSLRGGAALSVVLFHIGWRNIVEGQSWVRQGYLMVDLFFVLSGFVVFYAYGKRIKKLPDVPRFMWLRFWRLYPLHFALLIVFLLIESLKGLVQWHLGLVANDPAFSTNNIYSFIGNLFLVQSLHIFPQMTFNHPAWSISVEFYTYVMFALLVVWSGSRRMLLIWSAVICIFGAVILSRLSPVFVRLTFDFGIFRCITGFFLGVLTFAAYEKLRTVDAVKVNARFMGWLALMAMVTFFLFMAFKPTTGGDLAIYPLSAILIVLIGLAPLDGPTRFLTSKPFAWLGDVSYSIYMVHSAVIWGMTQVIRFVFHAKVMYLPFHDGPVVNPPPMIGFLASVATVVLVLLVSHFTFKWIERPLRDWSKTAWPGASAQVASVLVRLRS